ncbi:MAG TPA: hypothetical protein ENI27_10190 [bacterium]|nr:hypothetical protein [bacterium]
MAAVLQATEFDAIVSPTNQHLRRGADYTGNVDSKKLIVSFWFKLTGLDGFFIQVIGSQGNTIIIDRKSNNKWHVELRNEAGAIIFESDTTSTFTSDNVWRSFLFSCDLDISFRHHLLIDEIDVENNTTFTDDTIDFTRSDQSICADLADSNFYHGCISNLYYNPGEYLNFSIESNRRFFIDANGNAVPDVGSNPTGSAPLVYLNRIFSEFQNNSGSGGDLIVQDGPFVDCLIADEPDGPTAGTPPPLPIINPGADESTIEQWEAGSSKLSYLWRSKSFEVNPASFSAGKIEADFAAVQTQSEIDAINAQRTADIAFNAALLTDPKSLAGPMNNHAMNNLELNGDGLIIVTPAPGQAETVTFKLYGARRGETEAVLRHSITVSSNKPFRMDGVKKYRKVEIELSGMVTVREADAATSVGELQKR